MGGKANTNQVVPLLRTTEQACHRHLQKLFARGEGGSEHIEKTVRTILREVRKKGDRALCSYTQTFDRVRLTPETLAVTESEMDAALAALSKPERTALRT